MEERALIIDEAWAVLSSERTGRRVILSASARTGRSALLEQIFSAGVLTASRRECRELAQLGDGLCGEIMVALAPRWSGSAEELALTALKLLRENED